MAMENIDDVQWPKDVTNPSGDDLGKPVVDLIRKIHLMGQDPGDVDETKTKGKTPYSLQVITSDATAASKVWSRGIAAAGGISAILTALGAYFGKLADKSTQITSFFVIGVAVIIASALIAIALIVRSDVSSRALASAARSKANADVATAFLDNYRYSVQAPAAPQNTGYLIRKTDGSLVIAKTFTWEDGDLIVNKGAAQFIQTDIAEMLDIHTLT
jgi:hypothetical protein